MKKTLQLSELDCASCAARLETAIRGVKGVDSANINFVAQKLILEAEDASFDEVLARVKQVVARTARGCAVL